jgi:hypothetical protein
LVDSITQVKKTKMGGSMLQLAMHCKCCECRTFWFQRKEIDKNGSYHLQKLADQAEEFFQNGMDIQSENTFIGDDCEDNLFDI